MNAAVSFSQTIDFIIIALDFYSDTQTATNETSDHPFSGDVT